ncbi:hypothetical protein CP061683_0072A, partial [Chlamydia psittaci 06-1683]
MSPVFNGKYTLNYKKEQYHNTK